MGLVDENWDREAGTIAMVGNWPAAIAITERLRLMPTLRTNLTDDRRLHTLEQDVLCETRDGHGASWTALLRDHQSLCDLLTISRGRRHSSNVVQATHASDPQVFSRDEVQEQWRTVVAARAETAQPGGEYLITYNDLGVDGIKRWLELRDDFARAIDPIVSDFHLERVDASAHLAQSAPGIEALGYLLFLRDGLGEEPADRKTLVQRIKRVQQDLRGCALLDDDAIAERVSKAYNGLKHANRAQPDPVDIANAWRETVLLVRAWVAVELGVKITDVQRRLEQGGFDPPYVPAIPV